MKQFRFAWNGHMLDKQDTWMILFTIIAVMLSSAAVIICLIVNTIGKGKL